MDLYTSSFTIYSMVIHGLVLYAVLDLVDRSKVMSLLLFVAFPVVLIPILLNNPWNGWFNLAKSLTMLIVGAYFTLVRFYLRARPFVAVVPLLIILNLVEAILRDFESENWINFISGLLLLAMLRAPTKAEIDSDQRIFYPMSWHFIISYTVWNFCFIFAYTSGRGYIGDYTLLGIVQHAVPVAIAFKLGPQFWTHARGYSLAFSIAMAETSLRKVPEAWPLTDGALYSQLAYHVVSIGAFCIVVVCFLSYWFNWPVKSKGGRIQMA